MSYIDEDGLDFSDPREREFILEMRREEQLEKLKAIKKRNRTTLKVNMVKEDIMIMTK